MSAVDERATARAEADPAARRLRLAGGALLLVVAAGAAGVVVGSRLESPGDAAARRRPPAASSVTVPVERRALSSRVVARATIEYDRTTGVRLAGSVGGAAESQVVTETPAVGAQVAEGDRLAEVSGRPVVALQGGVPMFRTMRTGARGRDVLQLERALARLGRFAGTPDVRYDAATERAVTALYGALGYPVERGPSVDGTGDGVLVPAGEVVFLPELPMRVERVDAPVGTVVAGDVLTVSRSSVRVLATLPADEADVVKAGMTVEVEAGEEPLRFRGTVSGARRTTTAAGDVVVTVEPSEAAAARKAVGLPSRVTITVATSAAESLVVPVAAVSATGEGTSVVRVLRSGGKVETVRVVPGLSAAGYVVVTPAAGAALAPGDQVVVG